MSRRKPFIWNRKKRDRLRTQLFAEQQGLCHLCDAPMTLERINELLVSDEFATFDHLLPFALGGNAKRGNLKLAHRRCNLRRGIKDPLLC